MVENQIYIGATLQTAICFDSVSIRSLTITEECSLTGEELPADLVEAEVQYEADDGAFSWDTYPAGTGVWIYRDGVLYGKYYLDSVKQEQGRIYTIRAQSVIWMLSSVKIPGQHRITTMRFCISSILNMQGTSTPASKELYKSIVIDQQLTGNFLLSFKPCTIREALQGFLFANRLRLIKVGRKYVLSRLGYTTSGNIPPESEYTGGTMERPERIASVTVHGYEYSSEEVSIDVEVDNPYDQEITVDLDVPTTHVTDHRADPEFGVTLVNFIGNYQLRVTGSGIIRVWTPRRTDTEYVMGDKNADGTHYEIDNPMIDSQNAEALAQDLWNYYTSREDAKISTVDTGERCGNLYSFRSPFGRQVSGYLAKNVITASGINKGDKTIVCKYSPVKSGYTKSLVVTSSGSVTLPDEIFEQESPSIRVILIGGGTGGSSGYAGEDGGAPQSWAEASGGSGGDAGPCGSGGKVYQVTISGADLQQSYDVTIGEGGAGGSQCSSTETCNAGQAGGETTLGSYSSASGTSSDDGYIDPITKRQYGAKPVDVYSGGQGASGGSITKDQNNWLWYNVGNDYQGWLFDLDGKPWIITSKGGLCQQGARDDAKELTFYTGSCGGGAAYKGAGKLGTSGRIDGSKVYAPSGGDGGDAYAQEDADMLIDYNAWMGYGYGGLGGHGGGGGGAGAAFGDYLDSWGYTKGNDTAGGKGGKGGAGGKGAQGCVIILY